MIREPEEDQVRGELLHLMAESEAGSWFDLRDPRHLGWLQTRISRRMGSGGRFHESCGLVAVAELPGLNGPDDRGQLCLMRELGR